MNRRALIAIVVTVALVVIAWLAGARTRVLGQGRQDVRFAAVPGEKGGQDLFGAYDIVPNWPKPITGLPGHDKWTWGAGQSVFAESPNRVFILQRGELPAMARPQTIKLPQLGPNIEFPIGRLPWRDATSASPPGALEVNGKVGDDSDVGVAGTDFLWSHIITVADAQGNLVEQWTQWDKMFRRPHAIYISPYDPQKRVFVVDDYRHAVFIFTHDGKQLLKTLGEPNVHAADPKHFYRPTFIAWDPDGSYFIADGYANTRVVKYDKNDNYVMAWGEKGEGTAQKPETRPNYFNSVHGIAVDPVAHEVFVNDRNNRRIQVFDENGKFLRMWSVGAPPSDVHLIIMDGSRNIWGADRGTSKMVKWDREGNLQYTWGTWGDFPGGMWGVHGLSIDSEGNFYTAEVDSGRVQKYKPRAGARSEFLLTKLPAPANGTR
jgi:DNA-binding beta-propeller fold protein YncE